MAAKTHKQCGCLQILDKADIKSSSRSCNKTAAEADGGDEPSQVDCKMVNEVQRIFRRIVAAPQFFCIDDLLTCVADFLEFPEFAGARAVGHSRSPGFNQSKLNGNVHVISTQLG